MFADVTVDRQYDWRLICCLHMHRVAQLAPSRQCWLNIIVSYPQKVTKWLQKPMGPKCYSALRLKPCSHSLLTSWRIKVFKLTAFALKLSKFYKSFIDGNNSIHWTFPSWSCVFTDVIFFYQCTGKYMTKYPFIKNCSRNYLISCESSNSTAKQSAWINNGCS